MVSLVMNDLLSPLILEGVVRFNDFMGWLS